jgi:hypothetical protein
VRLHLLVVGAVVLLATTRCSTGSSDSSATPSPGVPLAGSSTPSMASVTGRQDLGMYNPQMGTKVYDSATPPPGNAYGR